MSRIYKISRISKIRSRICRIFKISKRGAGDCSSGAPAPGWCRIRRACPTEDARTCEKISSGPTDLEEIGVQDYPRPNRQDQALLPYRRDARTCAPGHGEGLSLALRAAARCFHRSAGACPPRAFDPRENRTLANAGSRSDRGMARACPSPYGPRHVVFTVARGPVPRERSTRAKTAR